MSIFSILNHPCSFMVYYYLWCFSTFVKHYFQVSFNLKVNSVCRWLKYLKISRQGPFKASWNKFLTNYFWGKKVIRSFATRLKSRGYPAATVEKHLSEVKFSERETSLTNRNRNTKENSPLCHTIPYGFAWSKKSTHGEMALDTEPTTAKTYLQGATPSMIISQKENP